MTVMQPTAWLTVDQFAVLVQLTPWTIRQHIRARRIPATYIRNVGRGGHARRYRINRNAVDAYQL